MADLPSGFWSGWIVVVTVVSLVTLAWLVLSVYFGRDENVGHPSGEDPVWDSDLREDDNAPPLWWFWLIFSAMIFSVVYLMLYPGLGGFRGMLGWSQHSRLEGSYSEFDQQFDAVRATIAASSLSELQNDPALMTTADRLFNRNCSACHGEDGQGQADLFPNLMDADWQWGATAEHLEQSIRYGRMATMPAWIGPLGEEGVNEVAAYVQVMGDPGSEALPGQARYAMFCAACHGMDGAGNPLLGAPNLLDDNWLYGGSIEAIRESVAAGRNGIMPAFNERLDDAQIKLLVARLTR
ncbi:MAG: cytochrome-c oxidase, cbb3-type subunit III [Gammaproteobacteria bacterium]|nr:cytochrome-c oxidase, cbb3-type subunit III [Gammaproteobacteria bacterium]